MKNLLLKIVFGFLLVYGIVGFFVLPGIIKTQIIKNASTALKRNVSVESVSLNPFAFSVNLKNLKIYENDSNEDFISIRNIELNVDPLYLVGGRIDINLISLSSPHVTIHKKADGTFNFADLLSSDAPDEKVEKTSTQNSLPNILIEKFVIKRGRIDFIDELGTEPFHVKLKPINFTIRDFSTQKDHGNELSLYIEIDDGAFVKYKGKINSLEPLQLEGGLQLHSGRLYTQWKYFQDTLGFIVADGALNAEMSYTADLSANPMQININQYKLDITALRLQDKQSKEDMLVLPSLALNGDIDITDKQVNVSAFDIKGLSLKAIRDKNGTINWLSYLPKSQKKVENNASEEPNEWKIDIKNVGINTQEILFEEHYALEPYRGGFKGLAFKVKDIHIDDKRLDINSYELTIRDTYLKEIKGLFAFEMPLFSLEGEAKLKQQEIRLHHVKLENIKITALKDKTGRLNFEKYAPFTDKTEQKVNKEENNSSSMKIQLKLMQVSSNEISYTDSSVKEPFRADIKNFEFKLSDMQMKGKKIELNQFKTKLSDLALYPLSSKKNWVQFKSLALKGKVDYSDKMNVLVHDLGLTGLDIYALMDENGEINFDHITPKATPTKKKVKAQPSALNWKIQNLNINAAKLNFEDKFNAKDALTKIDKINFNMKNLSSKKGSWSTNKLSLRINKAGQLTINSKLRQEPLKVYSKVRMKKLDLSKFQPYVEKKANADLNSGLLSFDIKAEHSKKRTTVIANTQINDLNISERKEGKTFFAFSKLLIKNIDLSLKPDQMKIETIDIYEPYARMKIDANHSTNLEALMVADVNTTIEDTNASTVQVQEKKKPFSVFIGKVNFKNGTGHFADLSLPLPFATDIHDLNGQMLALGTLEDIKTTTDIDGVVDAYGLMKIKGSLLSSNPKKFTDMEVKFQNIDMTNLSPYTGKFIGYQLKEGKMNVELNYKINASQMQGGNRIILKKLTLGEVVESEDAISAPVGLAIALLKDSEGVIDLDVSVEGDVDAPEFAIGHVVWTAFKNMIVGVATAPFRFLGNMLGMDADELDNVAFEEGKSKLLPPEREKLDKLAGALADKQMLTLQVAGSYENQRDLLAMKTASVYKEALAIIDDNTTDISKMDRDDLDDLLKEMYVTHFKKEKLNQTEEGINKKDMDTEAKKIALRTAITNALIEDQKVGEIDLISLANTRAQVIIDYLVSKGISVERLSLLETLALDTNKEESEYIPSKLELGAK